MIRAWISSEPSIEHRFVGFRHQFQPLKRNRRDTDQIALNTQVGSVCVYIFALSDSHINRYDCNICLMQIKRTPYVLLILIIISQRERERKREGERDYDTLDALKLFHFFLQRRKQRDDPHPRPSKESTSGQVKTIWMYSFKECRGGRHHADLRETPHG